MLKPFSSSVFCFVQLREAHVAAAAAAKRAKAEAEKPKTDTEEQLEEASKKIDQLEAAVS